MSKRTDEADRLLAELPPLTPEERAMSGYELACRHMGYDPDGPHPFVLMRMDVPLEYVPDANGVPGMGATLASSRVPMLGGAHDDLGDARAELARRRVEGGEWVVTTTRPDGMVVRVEID